MKTHKIVKEAIPTEVLLMVAKAYVKQPEELIEYLESVNKSEITITWYPTWDKTFMSDEAKLELGML